ncbi:MAG: hypothetical protein HY268_15230 [Deltaproteobacteria bacterium]|nr:hypothetical protein [Deltaproteobacteria bacterium]
MKQLLMLTIMALFLLLVAGWGEQATAGISAPTNIDHYKCYKVRGNAFAPMPVAGLVDEFEVDADIVATPVMLCNPTSKDSAPVLRTDRHLVCYKIRGTHKITSALKLDVHNQFSPNSQIMKAAPTERLLCVPSDKFCINDQGVQTNCPNESFNK